MNLGEKIRQLRRQNNVTQEKLASYLNISYQAISKWENGSSLPDISYVVPLANFFGVSTDWLFDMNTQLQNEEADEIMENGNALRNKGLVKEELAHWQSAVSKYPRNHHFIFRLANSLLGTKFSKAFEGDLHIEDNLRKAISLCNRIHEDCSDDEIRSGANQILVLAYSNLDEEDKAVEVARKATNMACSSDILLEFAYTGDKRKKQRHHNNLRYLDMLASNIVASSYDTQEQKIIAYKTAIQLWKTLIVDENYLFYHCRISKYHIDLAKLYAIKKEKQLVMDHLYQAKKHACLYDSLPDGEQQYTSILVDKAIHNNKNISKNYSSLKINILKENLENQSFEFLRNDEEFIQFKNKILNNI